MKASRVIVALGFILGSFTAASVQAGNWSDVEVGLNARVRAEGKSNLTDFNAKVSDSTDTVASRFRMSLSAKANDDTSIFFQPQFTKDWGAPTGTSGKLADTDMSVHQAYISHKMKHLENGSILLGRTELNYGDQLLIGGVGWHNVGRAFDAFRFRYDYGMGKVDFLMAEIEEEEKSAGTDTSLMGFYSMNDFGDFAKEVDFYFLMKKDNASGPDLTTSYYGVRAKSMISDFDYRFEYTAESVPTNLDKSESENQMDLELGYTLGDHRISAEYFSASKGYDQLAPTGHKWLGMADIFSRKNIKGFRVGVNSKFGDEFSAKLDFHTFSRSDNTVSAYNFTGGAYGTTGTDDAIGTEIDLILNYKCSDAVGMQLGLAQVTAGDYLKANMGNNSDAGQFAYLQMTANF